MKSYIYDLIVNSNFTSSFVIQIDICQKVIGQHDICVSYLHILSMFNKGYKFSY